jgi:hypothetical protein
MLVKFVSKFHLIFHLKNVPIVATFTLTIRQTQSQFVCLACGHVENADQNAAEVIKKRGIEEILKQATHGTWESARGGTRKTPKSSKLNAQTLRSENKERLRNHALTPGSTGL